MDAFLVPYDPGWPAAFAAERQRLEAALRPWLVTDVQHIGSTSIPGMPAKPILDLMAGVADLADGAAAEPALRELGYEPHPHRVDAVHYVRTGSPQAGLHLTVPGSDLWIERLTFRDIVRSSPALAAQYRALKEDLLAASGGRGYDASDKRAFVRRVLAEAGVTLRDDRHVPARGTS